VIFSDASMPDAHVDSAAQGIQGVCPADPTEADGTAGDPKNCHCGFLARLQGLRREQAHDPPQQQSHQAYRA
jgi:hypothetical protein